MTTLFASAESARRIVAAHEAWDWQRSEYMAWQQYAQTAAAEAVTVARAFLAMPEVRAAQWEPVLVGGRS